ncbi:FecR domain-containing protein [Candidatus Neomarinimicrobiota bacterium]
MKNIISRSATLLKLTLLIICLTIPLSIFAQNAAIARIVRVTGDVKLRRMADNDYATNVVPNLDLFNGDAIRATENSFTALIFIDDKTLLKIKDAGDVQIVESASARTVNLDSGILRSIIPQPLKEFRVETPVSVASVKGTDFWLISDPTSGTDQAYGVEGQVSAFNKISGATQVLTPNTMIISTAAGQLTPPIPVSPDQFPTDPDDIQPQQQQQPDGTGEPESEIEETPGEAPEQAPEVQQQLIDEADFYEDVPEPVEEPAEEPKKAPGSGKGMGLGIGSVTMDEQVYYQLALRPEFKIWKFGIGLDLVAYMDANGEIRKDEWDEGSDYLDKVYYLRYATENDPLFFKIGAMPQIQYGFGGLMDNYSNMTEYPQVRKVGFELGGRVGQKTRLKGFVADLKERGLIGFRGTYQVSKTFPLTLGLNFVTDLNQYGGLKDSDGDYRPDMVDDFPHDKNFWLDSDGDGWADTDSTLEFDIDGDNLTDIIYPNDPRFPNYHGTEIIYLDDYIDRSPEPFNLKTNERSISGLSFDLSYPILKRKLLNLTAYMEFSTIYYADTLRALKADDTWEEATSGTGLVGPGLRAEILKFLDMRFEYRKTSSLFQPGFFNSTYDLERASFVYDKDNDSTYVEAKDQVAINNAYELSGFYGSASANLFNIVTFGAAYQALTPSVTHESAKKSNSFIANLSANTDFIPKISEARAYYIRTNDDNPFDFGNPSSNTTWGYRVAYQVAAGVNLVYNMQESYRDLDGDGEIDPAEETVRLVTMETAFTF